MSCPASLASRPQLTLPPRSRRADNVGDNVGDIAGMGADLFGSFAESTCAALVVAAVSSLGTSHDMAAMYFPLIISGEGWGC
jgi:Na+/H+-translocating membrane pyrophosphatase